MTQSVVTLPSLGFPSSLPPGSGSCTSFLPGTKGGPTTASQANLLQRKGVHCTHSPVSSCWQGRDRAALLLALMLLMVASGAWWSLSRGLLSKSGQVWVLWARSFISLGIYSIRMPAALKAGQSPDTLCCLVPCQKSQAVPLAWCHLQKSVVSCLSPGWNQSSASQLMHWISSCLAYTVDTKLLTCNDKFHTLSSAPKVKSRGEKIFRLIHYSSKKMKIKSAALTDAFVMGITVNCRVKLLAACSLCLKDRYQTSCSLLSHRHFTSWKKMNNIPAVICIHKLNERDAMQEK